MNIIATVRRRIRQASPAQRLDNVVIVVEHEDGPQCDVTVRLRLVGQVRSQRRQDFSCAEREQRYAQVWRSNHARNPNTLSNSHSGQCSNSDTVFIQTIICYVT